LTFGLSFWNSVEDSDRPEELQGYLEQHPNGRFDRTPLGRTFLLPKGGMTLLARPWIQFGISASGLNLLAGHSVVWNGTAVRVTVETKMKFILVPALALLMAAGWATMPAQAAGCLKGAAVGGVAGHFAGHHGVLGAGAGCIIGHHEAAKHAREKAQQQQQGSNGD
jgi:hypothetical protein